MCGSACVCVCNQYTFKCKVVSCYEDIAHALRVQFVKLVCMSPAYMCKGDKKFHWGFSVLCECHSLHDTGSHNYVTLFLTLIMVKFWPHGNRVSSIIMYTHFAGLGGHHDATSSLSEDLRQCTELLKQYSGE